MINRGGPGGAAPGAGRGEHVAPLNDLVRQWRASTGPPRFVPWFDPDSGGTAARVLILLQSPAASTIQSGPEALSSEDNPNASSRALRAARIEAGLSRTDCLRWNIIPWAVPGGRAPTVADLDAARAALHAVLCLLPELSGIVTLGGHALTGVMRYFTLHPDPVIVRVLAAPHPSPANGHRRAERHERTVRALQRARHGKSGS
jgi:uracil-DNA glycosylase